MRVSTEDDRQRRRFQEIAEHYRLKILEGRIKAGDRLPSEREISEEFGVGRSSVREALFILSRLGLVSLTGGARARVTEPDPQVIFRELSGIAMLMLRSPEGVKELQHVRTVVESGLARQAAISASNEAIEQIRRALKDNEKAVNDPERFVATDVAFHRSIAEAVGNSIFSAMLDGLTEWLFEQRRVSSRSNVLQSEVLQHHERIFLAIEARDPAEALVAMEDHLHGVTKNYWRSMVLWGEHGRSPDGS
jgi:GntR family transcriptional regulator, sialic acid-inducible nan operon repressor